MFRNACKPVVFAGASLWGLDPGLHERIECLPPIREGDLTALARRSQRRPILILDGVFSENQAVTPTECRELLRKGWPLLGASSMGALRSADLWPEGMIGIGNVFLGYRTGLLRSDADVAVALSPFTYEELTVSSVFIRAALADLLARKVIDTVGARKMLRMAVAVHFLERTPEACQKTWEVANIHEEAWRGALAYLSVSSNNPKVHDAYLALAHLQSRIWVDTGEFNRAGLGAPRDRECDEVRQRGWESSIQTSQRPKAGPDVQICPACAYAMPAAAIFCPECASSAHENQ